MAIRLHNTRTRTTEDFIPIKEGHVGMYHCGPTVYDYAHIGNLRAYIFADVLRRMFEASGYSVTQVMNITDVGHLVSDGDDGEDKMEKGARREGKTVEEIIALYTNAFHEDLRALNILPAHHEPRATEHIKEQIVMIETLEKKGHTYKTSDGIYFDASTFPRYADFAHLDLHGLKSGARIGENDEKKNPYDFALWKFSGSEKRLQEWESPWGKGFPGWHIECSAMSQKYLGDTFDIHTGGIDHIPVHHTNEIAQSECANGVPLANYWLHSGFMTVEGEKMSKSLGNTFNLSTLIESGYHPMALRYLFLTARYDTQINFTWESFGAAMFTLSSIATHIRIARKQLTVDKINTEVMATALQNLQNNLDTPSIIAQIHTEESPATKSALLDLVGIDIDLIYSQMDQVANEAPSEEVVMLMRERDSARVKKDWEKSDEIRKMILKMGYAVVDTPKGTTVQKMWIWAPPKK